MKIIPHSAKTHRDWYNPSASAPPSAGQARYKNVTVKEHYEVKHAGGSQHVRTYNDAVKAAMFHANRKPRG